MATSGARRSAGQSNARSGETRQELVEAAIDALRDVGFAGASARAIANRAGSTQSQVFYHFGSVVDLLLAALDEVSARRMEVYEPLLESATNPMELLQTARTVILYDLESGDLKVLVEMVAGAQTVPGLGAQVAERLTPWYAVTGAFSYTGASITDELIRRGRRVRTLTAHPERAPASGTPVEIRPLGFADRAALRQSLEGVDTLYNTY